MTRAIPHDLLSHLRACRKKALDNMPSTKAIGRAVCSGKNEQAQRDALYREFQRGQVEAYDATIARIENDVEEGAVVG